MHGQKISEKLQGRHCYFPVTLSLTDLKVNLTWLTRATATLNHLILDFLDVLLSQQRIIRDSVKCFPAHSQNCEH